jgi:adenylate cyclase
MVRAYYRDADPVRIASSFTRGFHFLKGQVKRTGDGSIVEYRNVVDAVRCAIEVQNGMVERNGGLPAERRIEFRVGIHVGAASLEGIAEQGSVCLFEDANR